MMIALLQGLGGDVCARMHQKRHVDFRRGRRLGRDDRLITCSRPERPEWMGEATYQSIPRSLKLRPTRYHMAEPGFRLETITVISTLTDPDRYSVQDIADLYGFRWNAELDIRSTAAAAALVHGKQPRQISFTGTCQYVLSSWMLNSCGRIPPSALRRHAQTPRLTSQNRDGAIRS